MYRSSCEKTGVEKVIKYKNSQKEEILMENSHKFFENKECKYFPCHKGLEAFNCLFCYCPMYPKEKCLGNPRYIERSERKIKDCSNCTFPHQPENYDKIMEFLRG